MIFGTDGIRGIANEDLTAQNALLIGNALTATTKNPKIVIGTDTRTSKDMLKSAVIAGAVQGGGSVTDLGIVTTPAVAYYTSLFRADYGIVISASHNPAQYNGIKIFGSGGKKISKDTKTFIENFIKEGKQYLVSWENIGQKIINRCPSYAEHLINTIPCRFDGIKIGLDCANGASYDLAPYVFRRLGATVFCFNCDPDGRIINDRCGALHTDNLQMEVLSRGLDIGFAFDGDGDRLIAIDADGNIINGDHIIYILANYLKKNHKLTNDTVIGTHHTNMGMEEALNRKGIKLLRAEIGDEYVAALMEQEGAVLGGEQSGHIILKEFLPTGDGILSALHLLKVSVQENKSVSSLIDYDNYAQININVAVSDKQSVLDNPYLQEAISNTQKLVEGNGRILVRASGTEPKIRIMTECKSVRLAEQAADMLEQAVKKISGGGLCAE